MGNQCLKCLQSESEIEIKCSPRDIIIKAQTSAKVMFEKPYVYP